MPDYVIWGEGGAEISGSAPILGSSGDGSAGERINADGTPVGAGFVIGEGGAEYSGSAEVE